MKEILMVGLGGFVGSVARYSLGLLPVLQGKLNLSIITANLLGSFLIGILSAWFLKQQNTSLQLLLITGLCGGFTTFSTFSLQLLQYLKNDQPVLLLSYLLISLIGGVLLCFIGLQAGIKIFS